MCLQVVLALALDFLGDGFTKSRNRDIVRYMMMMMMMDGARRSKE